MSADAAEILLWLSRSPDSCIHDFCEREVKSYSYAQTRERVEQAATSLRTIGVETDARVGMIGSNSYAYLIVDLALLAVGAIPVAIPVDLPLNDGPIDLTEMNLQGLIVDESLLHLAPIRRASETGCVVIGLATLIAGLCAQEFSPKSQYAITPDTFTVVFSSGTTGSYRRLPIRWHSLHTSITRMAEVYEVNSGDRILVSLPLSSMQQKTLSYLAFKTGADLVLTTEGRLMSAMQDGQPSIILGPPAFLELWERQYQQLDAYSQLKARACGRLARIWPFSSGRFVKRLLRCSQASLRSIFGDNVRLMLVGSAPVRISLLEECAKLGWPVYQLYGSNEAGWIAWNTPKANRVGSVGQVAYGGTVTLSPDGEIVVRRPWNLADRYEENPRDTATFFDEEGGVRTGDLGRVDEAGYLYCIGRTKNVISTTGGQKISAEALEEILSKAIDNRPVSVFQSAVGTIWIVVWPDAVQAVDLKLVARRVLKLNATTLYATPVAALAIASEPFSIDNKMLSPNGKPNRSIIREKFEPNTIPLGACAA